MSGKHIRNHKPYTVLYTAKPRGPRSHIAGGLRPALCIEPESIKVQHPRLCVDRVLVGLLVYIPVHGVSRGGAPGA